MKRKTHTNKHNILQHEEVVVVVVVVVVALLLLLELCSGPISADPICPFPTDASGLQHEEVASVHVRVEKLALLHREGPGVERRHQGHLLCAVVYVISYHVYIYIYIYTTYHYRRIIIITIIIITIVFIVSIISISGSVIIIHKNTVTYDYYHMTYGYYFILLHITYEYYFILLTITSYYLRILLLSLSPGRWCTA